MDRSLRRIVAFPCEDATLIGTVDEAAGGTGLLIVSGGNEVRCGAHRGMALLAHRLAASGVPVFRFDRRGIGDSEGRNGGYATSTPDIAAALEAFRREQPHLTRVIGFGNCDAATALVLFGHALQGLVLANPWLGDEQAELPPAALREHYFRKLRSADTWRNLLHDFGRKVRDLRALFRPVRDQPLNDRFMESLAARPATVILAARDRTAQVFAASIALPPHVRTIEIATASHSFADAGEALEQAIRHAIATPASNRGPLR